jgi:cell division GTPase FtsZ
VRELRMKVKVIGIGSKGREVVEKLSEKKFPGY